MPVDEIVPYDNNPRRIPQSAVDAVAHSIELFGWKQPIVVDEKNVIIVGHTRRLAAIQLGYTHVPVHVAHLSPEKVKEYRLVDNKTGEMTGWDYDALVLELREFEQPLLEAFFPDIDIEIAQVSQSVPTDDDVKWAEEKINKVSQAAEDSLHLTTVVCPDCGYEFKVRTKSLPGMGDPKVLESVIHGGIGS
jgi:site-specific DNA-methyltransferase (adenine-specific)